MPRCFVASAIGGTSCRGIVDRDLRRLLDRVVIASLVDVVVADDVGNEYAVENAALERPRKVRSSIRGPCTARIDRADESTGRRLVADAIHVERVEAYLPRHSRLRRSFCSGDPYAAAQRSRTSARERNSNRLSSAYIDFM